MTVMKWTTLLVAVGALSHLAAGAEAGSRAEYEAWKFTHGKAYASEEADAASFAAWQANRDRARTLAAQAADYWGHDGAPAGSDEADNDALHLGPTEFADETSTEFAQARCGLRPSLRRPNAHLRQGYSPPHVDRGVEGEAKAALPDAVDWRKEGVVTDPKNQGTCGSCWAFATVASIEGAHARASGQLVSLSEQNLVDCVRNETLPDPRPGEEGEKCCMGCQGGLMDFAFEYLIDHQQGAIDNEKTYEYAGSAHRTCQYRPSGIGAKISGWVDIPEGDEDALMLAVATKGPVAVGVDASMAWQLYLGGVFPHVLCSSNPESMDHGVTVVGYGTTTKGKDYWIIKNSWGGWWGEEGYIRITRGFNACGIANAASYPVV